MSDERLKALEGHVNALTMLSISLMMQLIMRAKNKRMAIDHLRGFLASEAERADSPAYDRACAVIVKRLEELTEQNERRKN